MPSMLRTLMLALPAVLAAILITAPVPSVSAVASPDPLPMPLWAADYSSHLVPIVHATRHNMVKRSHLSAPVSHPKPVTKPSTKQNTLLSSANATAVHRTASVNPSNAFRASRRGDQIAKLSSLRDEADLHAQNLRSLASDSASQSGHDADFQRNAASELTSFQSSMSALAGLLDQLGADEGLANYDKTDELETILKAVVNDNKDALSAVTTLVYNIPGLGPILGPIVYEIKCLIDDVLDITENVTDGLVNDLAPILGGLLGMATSTLCSSQFEFLNLCL